VEGESCPNYFFVNMIDLYCISLLVWCIVHQCIHMVLVISMLWQHACFHINGQ